MARHCWTIASVVSVAKMICVLRNWLFERNKLALGNQMTDRDSPNNIRRDGVFINNGRVTDISPHSSRRTNPDMFGCRLGPAAGLKCLQLEMTYWSNVERGPESNVLWFVAVPWNKCRNTATWADTHITQHKETEYTGGRTKDIHRRNRQIKQGQAKTRKHTNNQKINRVKDERRGSKSQNKEGAEEVKKEICLSKISKYRKRHEWEIK